MPQRHFTPLHSLIDTSPNLAGSTRIRYIRDLDEWIDFAKADPLGWTPIRAQEFYQSKLNQGLKPQSANRLISSVRYASKWWSISNRDPRLDFAKDLRTDDVVRRTDIIPLSQDEATALILTCGDAGQTTITPLDIRDRALIVMGLETGMRRMSLIGMQLEGFDSDRSGYPTILVPIKGQRDQLYPVPLSDVAVKVIRPWQEFLASKKVRKGPVFRQLNKQAITVKKLEVRSTFIPGDHAISDSMINKMIQHRANLAGINRHVHPHLFRHTFLSWRGQQGLSPIQMASITGHKLNIGALAGYIDMRAVAETARSSTPPWFAQLIDRIIQ